ncbi:MAG: RagB/SusD family nutrient uptake outer membrane protein [Tannerellaceae bacterium]
MQTIKFIQTISAASMICLFSSCVDFLDVSQELSQNLDKDVVFSTAKYIKQWYGEIYRSCPLYSETGYGVHNNESGLGKEFTNPWAILSGEIVCAHPNVLQYGQNTFTPSSTPFNKWAGCYQQIRQAMIFLQKAPESIGIAANQDGYISVEEMRRMKADATYLLAYNYFQLFELYGPVPIIPEIADPENSVIDYDRASVDEMVNHIDELLSALIDGTYKNDLPETIKNGEGADYDHDASMYDLNNILRPTKAAALALRARLWVYAASPLFNGGYEEALSMTDTKGKHLFPVYDATKWGTAKTRLEDLLKFAESKGMGLYYAKNRDPHTSIYELFQYYNDEILWANGNNDYNDGVTAKMEARTIPGDIPSGMGNVGLYQEIVDLFFTDKGLSITEDKTYNENGFSNLENPCTTIGGKVTKKHVDNHIFNMYANREPRFYANVTYEGKSWHIQRNSYPDWGAYFSKGGAAYRDNTMHARGGYLFYKFNNRSLLKEGSYPTKWGRPWIYFRLADFYLYYAEVCNEINPSDPNIIKYLDMVRMRAGIPGYGELKSTGAKNIVGDQEAQREAIYHERNIELLGEGNYYFDMHRWMRAGWSKDDSGNLIKNNDDKLLLRTGMDIDKPAVTTYNAQKNTALKFKDDIGEGSYYNRIVKDRYPWKKAMLLYPIPYDEMQKSKLIVQNPLWD